MHHLRILILSICTLLAQAQVNVMISDETSHSFLLGVDGYVQNTEPVKKLVIEKLDTSRHIFHIYLNKGKDTVKLVRPVKLPKAGNYHYVIMQNYDKQFQLRYRGVITSFPAGVISMDHQTILEWPRPGTSKPVIASTTPAKKEAPQKKIRPQATTSAIQKSDSLSGVITRNTPVDIAVIKELVSTPTPAVKKAIPPPPQVPPFEQLLSAIREAEYEFVKLNLAKKYSGNYTLSTTEIQQVFKEFQYDNTRLQFLNHASEKISDPQNIKQLEQALEFDLSKEQFKKKYP